MSSLAAARLSSCRLVILSLALVLARTVRAADPWEFWPELNLYKGLGSTTRLYFVGAYADGKESVYQTTDMAAYFDLTLEPLLREAYIPNWRSEEDWRQKRYLWIRVGYDHVFKQSNGSKSTPEDRAILSVMGRAFLPAGILLEGRFRTDLRWIGGDYSTRYRFRGELNRDFDVFGTVANVYLQAEFFYDTRYDGWARQLFQVGTEIVLTRHFRVEPYLARQVDLLPSWSPLNAVGIVARWYY